MKGITITVEKFNGKSGSHVFALGEKESYRVKDNLLVVYRVSEGITYKFPLHRVIAIKEQYQNQEQEQEPQMVV